MLVCELLGKVDRRSLSLTCQPLFSLVNAAAPFRKLWFCYSYWWLTPIVRQHSKAVSSAYAIRWTFRPTTNGTPEQRSTDLLSLSAASLRHALSILSLSSSLHTLGLSSVIVEPAHQILILSIKTLRTVNLHNTTFAPTSEVMPRSSIKSLFLQGWSPLPNTLLGTSLETLRFNRWKLSAYEILSSTPLPRLTFLENSTIIKLPTHDYFASFRNITTLIISSLWPSPVPPTALPRLTYLSAPYEVGKALLPGRPVYTYSVHYIYPPITGVSIEHPLVELAPCAQHVKELHLWLRVSPSDLAVFLALHFPNVVRMHLKLAPSDLLDDGTPPWSSAHMHPSLREFDIGFYVNRTQPFPRESCRKVLTKVTKVCPVLEVVRFGQLFPTDGGGVDERDLSFDLVMDMRRTAGGEWKEKKWGRWLLTP